METFVDSIINNTQQSDSVTEIKQKITLLLSSFTGNTLACGLSMRVAISLLRRNKIVAAEKIMVQFVNESEKLSHSLAHEAIQLANVCNITQFVTKNVIESFLIAQPHHANGPPVVHSARKFAKKLAAMFQDSKWILPPRSWYVHPSHINIDTDELRSIPYTCDVVFFSTRPVQICLKVLALAIAMHTRNTELRYLLDEFTAWRRSPGAEFWCFGYLAWLPEALVVHVCSFM
jgi:hypothetical protein